MPRYDSFNQSASYPIPFLHLGARIQADKVSKFKQAFDKWDRRCGYLMPFFGCGAIIFGVLWMEYASIIGGIMPTAIGIFFVIGWRKYLKRLLDGSANWDEKL